MNTIFKISLIPVILFLLKFCPVTAQTPFKSLNYLYSISGTKTVAGIHNREPNSNPDLWTDSITVLTGKTPGLWSGDFLFSKTDVDERWNMIYEAEEAWNKGSLINLMWHTCSPAYSEPCRWNEQGVLDKLTDEEWESLIKDGEPLNVIWKKKLDDIALCLQYLEDKGIEVFFRPFHEMNQPVFWWAGRKGSNGTAKLFQITHDYLTKNKGLKNLIFRRTPHGRAALSGLGRVKRAAPDRDRDAREARQAGRVFGRKSFDCADDRRRTGRQNSRRDTPRRIGGLFAMARKGPGHQHFGKDPARH